MTVRLYRFGPAIVASDVALHELEPAGRGRPAWTVRTGDTPARRPRQWLQQWSHRDGCRPWGHLSRVVGGYLVTMVASRFLIDPERRAITVAGRAAHDVALRSRALVSQVLPLALSLDHLVVHASAVVVDGRLLVFAGRAGIGKSTLAAWAVRHGGASLAADDVLCLGNDDGGVRGLAHPIGVRLTPDAVARLEATGQGRERRARAAPKASRRWLPVAGLFMIERGTSADLQPLQHEAVPALVSSMFWLTTDSPRAQCRHFMAVADLCTRVPVYRLTVPPGLAHLDAAWHLLMEAWPPRA